MAVVGKLLILTVCALLVTLGLIALEWRTKQLSWRNTGVKGVAAVVLAGVLVSLLIVK